MGPPKITLRTSSLNPDHIWNKVGEHGSDRSVQVLGRCAGSACNRETTLDKRFALVERFLDGLEGPDILDDDADVSR